VTWGADSSVFSAFPVDAFAGRFLFFELVIVSPLSVSLDQDSPNSQHFVSCWRFFRTTLDKG
jgi:hypothetical protein